MEKAQILLICAECVLSTSPSYGTSLTAKYFQSLAKLQRTLHKRQLLHPTEAEVKTEPYEV